MNLATDSTTNAGSDSVYVTSTTVEAAPEAVVEAILDPHGWWDDDCSHLQLAGLVPGEQVIWHVLDAPGDHGERIVGRMVFDVVADAEGHSTVTVTHTGARPEPKATRNGPKATRWRPTPPVASTSLS
jgi:hypothetical protein